MDLVVTDAVQEDGFLATLAFRNEMMLVSLILWDYALAHRTENGLWRRLVP